MNTLIRPCFNYLTASAVTEVFVDSWLLTYRAGASVLQHLTAVVMKVHTSSIAESSVRSTCSVLRSAWPHVPADAGRLPAPVALGSVSQAVRPNFPIAIGT